MAKLFFYENNFMLVWMKLQKTWPLLYISFIDPIEITSEETSRQDPLGQSQCQSVLRRI